MKQLKKNLTPSHKKKSANIKINFLYMIRKIYENLRATSGLPTWF